DLEALPPLEIAVDHAAPLLPVDAHHELERAVDAIALVLVVEPGVEHERARDLDRREGGPDAPLVRRGLLDVASRVQVEILLLRLAHVEMRPVAVALEARPRTHRTLAEPTRRVPRRRHTRAAPRGAVGRDPLVARLRQPIDEV